MKTWFTADLHLGHANIIKYCNRPFKTLEEMNSEIIRRWNERIKPNDFVYHIGDFCFRNSYNGLGGVRTKAMEYLSQLNGYITFIRGNHDKNNSLPTRCKSLIYESGNVEFDLVHNPINISRALNTHLVGHVHNAWKIQLIGKDTIVNVGVDVWDFYPIHLGEILGAVSDFKKMGKI